MNWQAAAAVASIAGVVFTILSGMALLIYNAGRHSQRLDAHEQRVTKLENTQEKHALAISGFEQFVKQCGDLLQELRDDVKALITGKILPARRRSAED